MGYGWVCIVILASWEHHYIGVHKNILQPSGNFISICLNNSYENVKSESICLNNSYENVKSEAFKKFGESVKTIVLKVNFGMINLS